MLPVEKGGGDHAFHGKTKGNRGMRMRRNERRKGGGGEIATKRRRRGEGEE